MGVTTTLSVTKPRALPGAVTSWVVRLRNAGLAADEFLLAVVGRAAGWATIEPATLRLEPGQEAVARLVLKPPAGPDLQAGEVPFAIRTVSRGETPDAVVYEGAISVEPATRLAVTVSASEGPAESTHSVVIDNLGGHDVVVDIVAVDPGNRLRFDTHPATVEIAAGRRVAIALRAEPRNRLRARFRAWPRQVLPFQVILVPEGAPTVTAEAVVDRRQLLSRPGRAPLEAPTG